MRRTLAPIVLLLVILMVPPASVMVAWAAEPQATVTDTATDCAQCPEKRKLDGDDQKKATREADQTKATDRPKPFKSTIFSPPSRGAPVGREGGATRGSRTQAYGLQVLAPDQVGLSGDARPSLYWFNAKEISLPVDVVVADVRGARDARYSTPVVELRVRPPVRPGVHCLRLVEHTLSPGTVYEWSVAVVADAERRSNDSAQSFGRIEIVERPGELDEEVGRATATELPGVYGKRGLWYDLVAALMTAIEIAPNDAALRVQAGALMAEWARVEIPGEQLVGLKCLEDKLEMDAAVLEVIR